MKSAGGKHYKQHHSPHPSGPNIRRACLLLQAARRTASSGLVEGLDSRLTFENFVVGAPNQLAFAIAKRVAESAEATYNPLFLYGGVGLGKTHLMHAIAWEISFRQPHRKVMYLSAEKFMYRFIRALRYRDMMSFKEQFRSVDVLMIDDVQFISGKDSTQEEFFILSTRSLKMAAKLCFLQINHQQIYLVWKKGCDPV